MLRISNLSCKYRQNTIDYINKNILKGIKFEDLVLKEELNPTVLYEIYGE